ncbi:MAG: PAS domain S-box protein [Acidimicrobiales bacterium]
MSALSRLGVRLAAATLLVGLVGGVLGGLVARQSARDSANAEARHLTVGLAERLANEIDSHIDGLATSLRVLSTREQIVQLGDRVETELAIALRSFNDLAELDVHDARGNFIAAAANDRLVDPALVPPSPLADLQRQRQRTELTPGPQTFIDITVPIDDPPGTAVGTLRGRVPIDAIVQVLEARLLGASANAIFIGPDAVILDHPEQNRVLAEERYPIESIPPNEAGSFKRDGTRILAAMATPATSGLPGAVVIEWDQADALALADRQARLVGILVALIVLASVAVLLATTSRLLRPLEALRETVQRLAGGDRSARATETGAIEFREVSHDINVMAEAVDEQLTDLHEAEERIRRIITSSPDVFIVVDGSGRVELASARVADMFGYAPRELIGQPVETLVPERFRERHKGHRRSHHINAAREMGSLLELFARRSDGSEFRVEISLSPIMIDHEPKVLATVRDVTERIEGETAKRELSEVRSRQRQAIEINDTIVQGLTVARWSFDLGDVEAARTAVEETVVAGRLLVDRMLSAAGEIQPGDLRRDLPVGTD